MENKSKNITIRGLDSTLLLISFIVLKLCHVIEWPWLWVLSPLWISFALSIIIIMVITIWAWVNR